MDLTIRRLRLKNKKKQYKGWPMTAPDRENYMKPINDVLEGIMYKNDAQICAGETIKIYADVPGIDIEITELGEYSEMLEP
jgi:Holliday junction resolvase RusA-like endonuclease